SFANLFHGSDHPFPGNLTKLHIGHGSILPLAQEIVLRLSESKPLDCLLNHGAWLPTAAVPKLPSMKVLVLDIPALHLGYVGCYGNQWIETPHFDQLAAQSVVFDQHYADSPGVTGEMRTCRTGRYQLPAAQENDRPDSDEVPVLSRLLAAGKVAFGRIDGSIHKDSADGEMTAMEGTLHRCLDALDQVASKENWLVWVD